MYRQPPTSGSAGPTRLSRPKRQAPRAAAYPPPLPEPKPKKKFPYWTLPVIALCVSLLVAAYIFSQSLLKTYDAFNARRAAVSGDAFLGAVTVDGLSLQGLTMDEARGILLGIHAEQAQEFELFIKSGDSTFHLTADQVPMDWNTEVLLRQAYTIGRGGSLERRLAQVQSITEPVELFSEYTYDKATVRKITDSLAAQLETPAQDATVVAFDAINRTFTFNDESPGQRMDPDTLYAMVVDPLDQGMYGITVYAEPEPVMPLVTRAVLERDYGRIASYTTDTTDNENRNTNIRLAAEALNGRMIPAGETLSFNETTGQRTREKGYQEAGAIENGRTVQEVGGGVCQVSTTLFNAMLRADCAIASRKPHAWPSDYVPRGEDAAVDWPNLDLVMRNTSDAAIFITAFYENRKVTVEVYGISLGDGVSIELESETTYSKKPTETVYTYNGNLAVGTQKLLKQARTGYSVQTYKIWLQDGQEVRREKLYTTEYKVINEEYEYNDGKPPAGS